MSDIASIIADGHRPSIAELIRGCPFRSVLSRRRIDRRRPLENWDAIVAVLGGIPEPLSPEVLQAGVECLSRGETVLLLSDRQDLCDRAKHELLAMAGDAGGQA